jgi:hypothetical protein
VVQARRALWLLQIVTESNDALFDRATFGGMIGFKSQQAELHTTK